MSRAPRHVAEVDRGGFGLVVSEALCKGTPVVAGKAGRISAESMRALTQPAGGEMAQELLAALA